MPKRIDKLDIAKKASIVRNKLHIRSDVPVDLFSVIHTVPNMTVMYLPMRNNISGVCIHNDETPLIAINSSMSIGRQHFSLAHELYHFYFDDSASMAVSGKSIGAGSDNEKQADLFASYFLIPLNGLIEKVSLLSGSASVISLKMVVHLEQYFKVSRQAILVRLLDEGLITAQQKETFSQNVSASAINLGYSDTLYRKTPDDKAYGTFGHYIQIADKLQCQDKVSDGRFEELLLSAFRADLVYGDDQEGLND